MTECFIKNEVRMGLAAKLGLMSVVDDGQVWEIGIAHQDIAVQAVEYYLNCKDLTDDEKFVLMIVILGSVDEYMIESQSEFPLMDELETVMDRDYELHARTFGEWACWECVARDEGWGVTPKVRWVVSEHTIKYRWASPEARYSLANKLGLSTDDCEELYWELTVCAPDLAMKFVDEYIKRDDLSEDEKFVLMMIVIESVEEYMGMRGDTFAMMDELEMVLKRDYQIHEFTLDDFACWSVGGDGEAYYIAPFVRRVIRECIVG
ncbi:hypothetical protein JD969_19365 [Planctomycetota bacterium]|nr:hypothetical protein JD969_19365 [Planctomycetota bacterium]